MKKAEVYQADEIPGVDCPSIYLRLADCLTLCEGHRPRAKQLGPRTFQYLPDSVTQATNTAGGYDGAVDLGNPTGYLDAWGVRPSGGISVWQYKTR